MTHLARTFEDDVTPMREPSVPRRLGYESAMSDATGGTLLDWSGVYERYLGKKHRCPIWGARINGRPIEVVVYQENDFWVAENSQLDVLSHGESLSAALREAKSALAYLQAELVNEPNENLSANARRLKQLYGDVEMVPDR